MIDSGIIEEARLNLGMLFPQALLIHREISVTWRSKETTNNDKRTIVLFLVQNIQQGFMHAAILMEKLDSIAESFPEIIAEHMPQMISNTEIISSNELLGDLPRSNKETQFTNTLFMLHKEITVDRNYLTQAIKSKGLFPVYCDDEYIQNHLSSKSLDVFICHDSNDKVEVARPLAHELIKRQLTVWLDELSLKIGDSLIDSIEKGLQEAKCALIIISASFLQNQGWPKHEFKSLVSREFSEGRKIILPIWHRVTREEVSRYSIELADKFALNTETANSTLAKLIHQEITKVKAKQVNLADSLRSPLILSLALFMNALLKLKEERNAYCDV